MLTHYHYTAKCKLLLKISYYLTNMDSLMNVKILTNWTHLAVGHTLFGHEPPLDIYYSAINHLWTYIT